jgi:tetratricopeptide (TPR) repeat protein
VFAERGKRAAGLALLACLLLLTPLAAVARAEEDDAEIQATAARILRAADAEDRGALQALAETEHPDPWLVADALAEDGHLDAAFDLARGSDAPHLEGLAAWLAVRSHASDAVASVVRLLAEGRALRDRSELEASAKSFLRGAEEAARIGWRAAEAAGLYQAGLSRHLRGDLQDAVALHVRRLAVEQALHSSLGQGRGHFGIAVTLRGLARDAEAVEHLRLARAFCEEAGDREYLAKLVAEEAFDAALLERWDQALADFDRAIELLAEVDGSTFATRFRSSDVRLARTRALMTLNAASMAAELGDLDGWRTRADAALLAADAVNDTRLLLATEAQTLVAEGVFSERAGDFPDAVDAYEKALTRYRRLDDWIASAQVLRRIGGIESARGHLPRALDYYEQALAIALEIGEEREVARGLSGLGSTRVRMGCHAEGHALLHRALDLARDLRWPKMEVTVLAELSIYHTYRADFGRARSRLEEALAVPLSGRSDERRADHLMQLAGLRRALGGYDGALTAYAQALRIYQERGANYGATRALAGRASALLALGRTEAARAEIEHVLAKARGRQDVTGEANALFLLGQVAARSDAPETALARFSEARALSREHGDVPRDVRATLNVAWSHMWLNQVEESDAELTWALAQAEAMESLELRAVARSFRAMHHLRLAENETALWWARLADADVRLLGTDLSGANDAALRARFTSAHEIGAVAAMRLGDPEALLHFLESGRGVTLLAALGGRASVRESASSTALLHAEEAARIQEARALALYGQARREGKRSRIRAERAALREAREAHAGAIQAIQRADRVRSDIAWPAPARLAAVQAELADDEALVLYGLAHGEALALVVRGQAARIVPLGDAAEVEDLARTLLLEDAPYVVPVAAGPVRNRLVTALALDPGVRRVLISPDGPLAYLPFALLADTREVIEIPSASSYLLVRHQAGERGEKVLAFGDPVYGRTVAAAGPLFRGGRDLLPLPGTRKEARAVGDIIRLSEEATETRFLRDLRNADRWRAVHLACHGIIDADRPLFSALALTSDEENDGNLTVLDVLRLEISADLAVLSGCETGRGKIVRGEGILGLTRAFMAAGVPAVLVSLWPVDDDATQAFMQAFYGAWNPAGGAEGAEAATALRIAQDHVRTQPRWAHPQYWAGWTLWGRPR